MNPGWGRSLDPRVQVLGALAVSVALLASPYPRLLVPAGAGWLAAWGTLDERARRSFLRSVVFLAAVTVALGAWLSGDRTGVPWFLPTGAGLVLGTVQAVRVSGLGAVMAWLVALLSIWKLSRAVEWSLRGVPAWRLAFHRRAFALVLAWSMVPGLWDETRRQVEVQRLCRGPGAGRWTPGAVRTLVPGWFHGMARRAEALSEALVLRGYRAGRVPHPVPFRLGWVDGGAVVVLSALLWFSLG